MVKKKTNFKRSILMLWKKSRFSQILCKIVPNHDNCFFYHGILFNLLSGNIIFILTPINLLLGEISLTRMIIGSDLKPLGQKFWKPFLDVLYSQFVKNLGNYDSGQVINSAQTAL